jgi:hypothetical protein
MKKILGMITLIISLVFISGCNQNNNNNEGSKEDEIYINNDVSIITPNGTPYIAISSVMNMNNKVHVEAVNGAANLQAALVSGSHDIVVAPVNLGANLYNKGNSKYQLAAVITMNNAYIVTEATNNLESISDLENQKVIAFGKTGIPGSILSKIYNENENLNLDNVEFTQSSSTAVYSLFAGGTTDAKYALMSQPEIARLTVNDNMSIKTLDLCDVLGIDVPQACIYVNPESKVLEDVDKVLKAIENSIDYLNRKPNDFVDVLVTLDRTFDAIGSDVLKNSIPNMDIVYKTGVHYKTQIEGILTILGVALPNEAFYYQK